MRLPRYHKIRKTLFLMFISLSFVQLQSCDKKEDVIENTGEEATVVFDMLGVEPATDDAEGASGNNMQRSSTSIKHTSSTQQAEQVTTIPFNDEYVIEATLTSDVATTNSGRVLTASTKKSENNSGSKTVLTPLTKGILYKVAAYDKSGKFIGQRTYNVGEEATQGSMSLYSGQEYTFVVYSVNNKDHGALKLENDEASLNEALLKNVTGDLMYFTTKLKLNPGENRLPITLKHMFSQITTNIWTAPLTFGGITAIENPVFKPTHVSANLKLANGELHYNELNEAGAEAKFSAIGSNVNWVSSQTILIHEGTESGSLTFKSLTIGGKTNPLTVPNIKITPGHKYNLNLVINKTLSRNKESMQTAGGALNFSEKTSDGKTGINVETFNSAEYRDCQNCNIAYEKVSNNNNFAPYGGELLFDRYKVSFQILEDRRVARVFDILQLNSAFNIKINDEKLIAGKNIQLEGENLNIRFMDGSAYGDGTVPSIANLKGNGNNPLIKVVISQEGQVYIYGAKSSNGETLYPMQLTSGSFNKIDWKSGPNNTAKIILGVQKPITFDYNVYNIQVNQ